MLSAYFDTNVYDAIDKGDIPSGELQALRAALARGQIVAHLSFVDVEELLGQWNTDRRPAAVSRLQVARDLVRFNDILKPSHTLLEEGIRAYANGTPLPATTLPRRSRRFTASLLTKVARGRVSESIRREVSKIVANVKKRKEAFRPGMRKALEQTRAELKWESLSPDQRRGLTFEAFWTAGATQWAEGFANRIKCAAACRQRGLDGLLRVRPVRLGVGAAISLVFSQVAQGHQQDFGDGYDLWHAVTASVADVFVTFDRRFADNLARVPVAGFRVVRSIPELLGLSEAASS